MPPRSTLLTQALHRPQTQRCWWRRLARVALWLIWLACWGAVGFVLAPLVGW